MTTHLQLCPGLRSPADPKRSAAICRECKRLATRKTDPHLHHARIQPPAKFVRPDGMRMRCAEKLS